MYKLMTAVRDAIVMLLVVCAFSRGQNVPSQDSGTYEVHTDVARYSQNPGTPWPATDALGRVLPMAEETGPPRPDRFAGIFYFLWEGQHDATDKQPFVVTDILRQFPNALKNPGSPPWGPEGSPHYWGEPLFGFYLGAIRGYCGDMRIYWRTRASTP